MKNINGELFDENGLSTGMFIKMNGSERHYYLDQDFKKEITDLKNMSEEKAYAEFLRMKSEIVTS